MALSESLNKNLVYAHAQQSWPYYLLVAAVILSVSGIILAVLLSAPGIARVMGHTGMNVVTRVMGLILASIAVEFIAKGLTALFPILGKGIDVWDLQFKECFVQRVNFFLITLNFRYFVILT